MQGLGQSPPRRGPRAGDRASFGWVTLLAPTAGGRPVVFEDPTRPPGVAAGPAPGGANVRSSPAPAGRPAVDGLHLRGLYLANPRGDAVVEDFIRELAKSPYLDLDLKNPKTVILSRSPPGDQAWAFDFELQLRLKPDFTQPLP